MSWDQSCQRIEQIYIQETDVMYKLTSDESLQTIDLKFCSCFSAQNILQKFENITPISTDHPNARYIVYSAYNNTLIVLGDTLIGHYFVSNLTRFQSFIVTMIPFAVLIDSKNIYISFAGNEFIISSSIICISLIIITQ